ncbi:MAG: LysM peptidoglycan-binding domain-containing protein [Imperialibacter sp.]|uniref:LysM peptidoglycan-binding domain-containing protein n=1 Tax=Imperialibacter sp. TaxID=2038411 RepID=UPI0032EDD46C
MRKLSLAFVTCLVLVANAFGQGAVQLNEYADDQFRNGHYAEAAQYYLQALAEEPNNQLATFQLAECYRNTFKYQEAELQYEKMINLSEANYPTSRYYFALMQKLNGKYQEAMENFQEYLKWYNTNPDRMAAFKALRLQALVEKEGCLLALNELANPVRHAEFKVLPTPVNTQYDDYAPFIFKGDSSLMMSSSRKSSTGSVFDARMGQSTADLFRFEHSGDAWTEIGNKDKFSNLNTKNGEGSGIFNKDNTKVYFTYNPPAGSSTPSQISKSELIDGKWSEPKPLNANINAKNTTSRHPSLSPGNDTLFFVSDRPGGFGQTDIWYSVDAGNDNWGPAINLGSAINTSMDEATPFFDQKEGVLFFSSNGHRGFGGFDIFMTNGNNFENSEIYNMGFPYNSNRDDWFFILGQQSGYLTSGRDGGVGGQDIYTFHIETDQEIIAEILEEDVVAGRSSVFSDDYNFDTNDIEKVEEVISHFLAARMFNTQAMLTAEQQAFYDNLSESDKEKIERIVNSRVRKMSERDLRAVRTEDEFYYQQLSTGDKYSINRMVSSYLEEDGLGLNVSLSSEEKAYYEQLSKDAKEKIDQYITLKVTEYRNKEVQDEYFQSLPATDQTQVKTLARSYLLQKKSIENLSLGVNTNVFLKKQDEQSMERAEASIVNQLKNLALESDFSLSEDDKVFYQNLPTEEQQSIDRLVTAFLAAKPSDFDKNITPADLEFYNKKPAGQKALIDKILVRRLRNLSFSDEYIFNHATAKQTLLLTSLNTKTNGNVIVGEVGNLLTGANRNAYSSLSEEEKLRFARMVSGVDSYDKLASRPLLALDENASEPSQLIASQSNRPMVASSFGSAAGSSKSSENQALAQGNSNNSSANVATQNSPASTTGTNLASNQGGQLIIDRREGTGEPESGNTLSKVASSRAATSMSSDQRALYESLPPSKRQAIDRIVAVSLINNDYAGQPEMFEEDKQRFAEFDSEERRMARRMAKFMTEDQLSTAEMGAIKDDFIKYKNYNPEIRKTFNHLILTEAFSYSQGRNQMDLLTKDRGVNNGLSAEEKSLVGTLIDVRARSNYIFGDQIDLENKYVESGMVMASVDQYQTEEFKNIKIQGRLVDIRTGKALANYPVVLANSSGETIKVGYTNQNGEFVFDYLDGNKAYKILSNNQTVSAIKPDNFFIKDLQVRGYKDGYIVLNYEGIYFDSDATNIRDEGIVTLNKLIELYRMNPEIEIEIHAHADSQGEHDYNHRLSDLRGDAVYKYLVSHGVDETALTVYYNGEGDPVASNLTAYGRAFNRRVELEVYSTKPLQTELAKIYVARPGATIDAIARAFNLPADRIQAMNGLQSRVVKPYTPIRIEGKNSIKPSLSLLVELNDHAVNYKQYKVKKGESIISIAEKFNLPEELLLELNNLNGYQLNPGDVIDIYVSY